MDDMAAHPDDSSMTEHIRSLSARAEAEADGLVVRLLGSCWPGGTGDRREPAALEWVRRWRPRTLSAAPAACSCESGRCESCN